jgi:FkbM family methyltransferase
LETPLAHVQSLLEQPNPQPDKALVELTSMTNGEDTPWPVLHFIGLAWLLKREHETALLWLKKAEKAGDDGALSYHAISICHHAKGDFEEAEKCEKQALEKENFYAAWMHLADIYRDQAKLKDALHCFQQAVKIQPENTGITGQLADIYRNNGRLDKALELLDSMANTDEQNMGANISIAEILIKKMEFDEAEECLNSILQEEPENKKANFLVSHLYRQKGDYKKALKVCEEVLEKDPASEIRINYAICLQELGKFDEAESNYLRVLKSNPQIYQTFSNYLMCIHYNPNKSKQKIFEAHKQWDQHYAPEKRPKRPVPSNKKSDKKLRIGLISGGFQRHPVGWMITGSLKHLPSDQFEIYCYTTSNRYDEITNRISEIADRWRSVVGYSDKTINRLIRDDEIDILIELSGHAVDNRLRTIALEPAPVIVKWVGGLFNTTGLEPVDFLITDQYESPAGEEEFYTEKLVRMPDDYVSYLPPKYMPDVEPPPAIENEYITFGCFNNPSKINEKILTHWAAIMNRLPKSRLMLKSKQYDTVALTQRIIRRMEQEGIAKDRLTFKGQSNHKDHLSHYNKIDIALDPWPYSGGLTTCEALYMGVPVITKPGPTFAGRHSTTHLANAGFTDWVVDTWDEYVEKSAALAGDVEQLAALRSSVHKQVTDSPLCNGRRFAAHLSAALREMWKQRVNGYESGSKQWQDHIDVKALNKEQVLEWTIESRVADVEAKHENENKFNVSTTENVAKNDTFEEPLNVSGEHGQANSYSQQTGEKSDVFKIETKDNVTICTPPNLNLLTPYVLLEQEQWFEPELDFVRQYVKPGMNILDIGAGFGAYALPMAKLTGRKGTVYAFEAGATACRHLDKSKLENHFDNLHTVNQAVADRTGKAKLQIADTPELNKLVENGTEQIAQTMLDAWWQFTGRYQVDFIKIDVNGDEASVLKGGRELLAKESPVILVAVGEGNQTNTIAIEKELSDKGYGLYEYVPGLQLLTEYDSEQETDAYRMNLIALKNSSIDKFRKQNRLFDDKITFEEPEEGYWKKVIGEMPWTELIFSKWKEKADKLQYEDYLKALDCLCRAEEIDSGNDPTNRSKKGALILKAVQTLVQLYNDGNKGIPISLTLARGLNLLGRREQAVEVMQSIMETNNLGEEDVSINMPFLLPLPEQDHLHIQTDFKKWLTVRIVEAWLLLKNVSSYFSGEEEFELLEMLQGNPENSTEIQKRIILSGRLNQKDVGAKLIKTTNYNRWFWEHFIKNKQITNNEEIIFLDIKNISEFSYSDPEGVAIIMPCINKETGFKTAKILLKRAGMPCKIIIVYDSVEEGFIQTLNSTANHIEVKYVVYLAQDAFPGMYWLKMAYTQLEKSEKGLLAFNDAKWNGIIASFGMVRTSWTKKLYDNAVLYPEYKSHCADDELTVIARATNQYIYNPNITLIEIDYEKGLAGGGNRKDRALFYQRYSNGFDGLAPDQKLKKLANDYCGKNIYRNNEERRTGDGLKHELLAQVHREFKPETYFEIGVQTGKSLALANCKAVGVDPNPQLSYLLPDNIECISLTSDDFFQEGAENWLKIPPDLAFIDGMHLIEYALRDFINVEKNASPHSIIIIDDILPAHPAQAERKRRTQAWTGDIWKLLVILREYRPELFLLPINASPTGLLFVGGLNPTNAILQDNYETIVSKYTKDIKLPSNILKREGVISCNDKMINHFLHSMKVTRLKKEGKNKISKRLKNLM